MDLRISSVDSGDDARADFNDGDFVAGVGQQKAVATSAIDPETLHSTSKVPESNGQALFMVLPRNVVLSCSDHSRNTWPCRVARLRQGRVGVFHTGPLPGLRTLAMFQPHLPWSDLPASLRSSELDQGLCLPNTIRKKF